MSKFPNFPLALFLILERFIVISFCEIPPAPSTFVSIPEYGYSISPSPPQNHRPHRKNLPILRPITSTSSSFHEHQKSQKRYPDREASSYFDEDSQSSKNRYAYFSKESNQNSDSDEYFEDKHRKRLRSSNKKKHCRRGRKLRKKSGSSLIEFLVSPLSKKFAFSSLFKRNGRNNGRSRDAESESMDNLENEFEKFDLDVDSDSRYRKRRWGKGWRRGKKKRRGRKRRREPKRGRGRRRRPRPRPIHYYEEEDDDEIYDNNETYSDEHEDHFRPGHLDEEMDFNSHQHNQDMEIPEEGPGSFGDFNTESIHRPEFHERFKQIKQEHPSFSQFPTSIYDKLPPPIFPMSSDAAYLAPSRPPPEYMHPPLPPLGPQNSFSSWYDYVANFDDDNPKHEEFGTSTSATNAKGSKSTPRVPFVALDDIAFMSPPKPYPKFYPYSSHSNPVPRFMPFGASSNSILKYKSPPPTFRKPRILIKRRPFFIKNYLPRFPKINQPTKKFLKRNVSSPKSTLKAPQIIYGKWNPLLDIKKY